MSAYPEPYARSFLATKSRPLLEYQQNFTGLTIAVIVVDVLSNDIEAIRPFMPKVREALPNAKAGVVTHIHG